MAWWRRWLGFVLAPLLSAGCFVGYDSRWGQQKQAQQHAAQRSAPRQLARLNASQTHAARRLLELRVYASPDYAASMLDWRKQFGALLARVNAVFGQEFGATLEVAEVRTFPTQASGEKLEAAMQQLTDLDPASDVDWVVGLIPATPRFAVSADDLGIARMPSRHIVMRGMSDPQEYEAIERGFSELSDEERHKLYRVRKEHKLAVTFLHELAHTLGVPHELLPTSLMNARYHVEASDFSEEAAEIMRASLASRVSPKSPVLDAALASKLDASFRAAGSGWEPNSRASVLKVTAQLLGSPVAVANASPVPQAPVPNPRSVVATVQGLDPEEQRSFATARAELNAGHAAHARDVAAPLFAKYPALPAIQLLRCDTAMAVGGDWDSISAECPGLSPFGGNK
jgi:hypothetical protein